MRSDTLLFCVIPFGDASNKIERADHSVRQGPDRQRGAVLQDDGSLDCALQFADVAGPAVDADGLGGLGGQGAARAPLAFGSQSELRT